TSRSFATIFSAALFIPPCFRLSRDCTRRRGWSSLLTGRNAEKEEPLRNRLIATTLPYALAPRATVPHAQPAASVPPTPAAPAPALPVPPPAAPAPPRIVNVIVFPGGFNWPIWVAQEKALFAKNGLEVKITPTPSSVFQLTNLIDGKFDIAMTAIDNLIAYREGQGEAPRLGPDLFAFMGCDNGFLRLVTVPEVGNYRELH